jgi:RHS repeat-associated protein
VDPGALPEPDLGPGSFQSGSLVELGALWTDYDGDEAYGDYRVSGTTVTPYDSFEPGLWRVVNNVPAYLHNDTLGTLRRTSSSTAAPGTPRLFTAFGEKLATPPDRFGYVGSWGYQSHAEMPFLHVGYRYYGPDSGRFLQRDPIGIEGSINVFGYVGFLPTVSVDPLGLQASMSPPVLAGAGGFTAEEIANMLGCVTAAEMARRRIGDPSPRNPAPYPIPDWQRKPPGRDPPYPPYKDPSPKPPKPAGHSSLVPLGSLALTLGVYALGGLAILLRRCHRFRRSWAPHQR